MKKTKIPKITLEQYREILKGGAIELIPAKKGFRIYIYQDVEYFKYIPV